MSKLKGSPVGRGSGQIGDTYLRQVRGRTIQCQMPTINSVSTRAPKAVARQIIFGLVNRYAKKHANSIAVSFNKTKYGSQRNYFLQVNYDPLKEALKDLPATASDTEIETAVTTYAKANPTSIYRVRLNGYANIYLTKEWADADNPVPADPDHVPDEGDNPLG